MLPADKIEFRFVDYPPIDRRKVIQGEIIVSAMDVILPAFHDQPDSDSLLYAKMRVAEMIWDLVYGDLYRTVAELRHAVQRSLPFATSVLGGFGLVSVELAAIEVKASKLQALLVPGGVSDQWPRQPSSMRCHYCLERQTVVLQGHGRQRCKTPDGVHYFGPELVVAPARSPAPLPG